MPTEPVKRIENPAFDAWMSKQGGDLLDTALYGILIAPPMKAVLRKTLATLLRLSWVQSEMVKLDGRMTDNGRREAKRV